MEVPLSLGWIGMISAILFFGFFTTPIKLKSVKDANVDAMLLQTFMSYSILLTSFVYLFIPNYEIKWSWCGVWGAAIWSPASSLSIFGIQLLGISIAQSMWGGLTMVFSFLWGVFLFNEELKNPFLAILGLFCLVIGVVGVSTSELDYNINCKKVNNVINETNELVPDEEKLKNEKINGLKKYLKYLLGVIIILIMSIINGSLMVPAKFDSGNINYMFSFGVGTFFFCHVLALTYFILKTLITKKTPFDSRQIRNGMFPGLMVGFLFAVGNAGQTFAAFSPLGLTIGFPVSQTCLVITALNGMIFFGELKTLRKKIQFFSFTILFILPGFFLLSLFG